MFIKTYHPKKSILPDRDAIKRILNAGWVTQAKMDGARAQIHILDGKVINYTRRGTLHTSKLSQEIVGQLLELFSPGDVVEGEWLRSQQTLYLFDMIKTEGTVLKQLNYFDRYNKLPRCYGPVSLLPIVTDLDQAMQILDSDDTEGLVFKSLTSKGFSDTSIVRCRKHGMDFHTHKGKRK